MTTVRKGERLGTLLSRSHFENERTTEGSSL